MYFWNPVFSFEIPGPARILLLILPTLHQQWPPRQQNNVLYKSLLEENVENCALSSMIRQLGCQSVTRAIIRKHASFPVTTSPDEQHMSQLRITWFPFIDADSSGKTQSLWLKIVIHMCKLNSLLLYVYTIPRTFKR